MTKTKFRRLDMCCKLQLFNGLIHQAGYLRAKCLMLLVFVFFILLFLQGRISLIAQTPIRYGDNLMDAIVCGTTDVFIFQGNAGDAVVIQVVELSDFGGVCGPACFCFDQYIELLDSANHVLAAASSPAGNNTQNRFRTRIGPEILPFNGTYKITIRDSHNNGRGEYSIFLQRTNLPERTNIISSGQNMLASLNRGEVDTYKFEARALDQILIDMAADAIGNIDPVIELYNSEGMPLALPGSGCIDYVLNCGGKFNVLAYSKTDQSGSYSIRLKVEMIPNNPPEANDDYIATDINTQVAIDVLANDTDLESNILKIASVSRASNGSVFTNGSYVIYDPDTDFTGLDVFTYKVTDFRDTSTAKVNVTVSPITGIYPESVSYHGFVLLNSYPNPFSQVTKISYELPAPASVQIMIFNMLGEKVETLVNDYREAGVYDVTFNSGGLCAGVYQCVMEADGYRAVKRIILQK